MTTIGERIRKLRIESGLTQKQLGERAKIAEPTIRKYELGKLNPKIETIQKIANALKVPIQLITEPKEFFTFMETDTHFIDLLRKKCSDEIEDFKRLSEEEQDCLFAGLFLDLERKYIDGDDSFFSDNELSK